MSRHLVLGSLLLLLTGCAGAPPLSDPLPPWRQPLPELIRFDLSGRVSVRQDGNGQGGGLTWQATPTADRIEILSPLGSTVALIEREQQLWRMSAGRQTWTAASPEGLMQDALGWSLPLGGMRHWIGGSPAPHTPSTPTPEGFRQLGWDIALEFREQQPRPWRIRLTRDNLEVRVVIDRWDVAQTAETPAANR